MKQEILFGCGFVLVGLSLIIFNRKVAEVQKQVDELFGMGSVSLRFNRTTSLVVGVLLCLAGIVVLLFMVR
ncbi:MAG TPA: hypothetical protein VGD61_14775 [Pyrinomonadaceae bacterium]